MSRFFRLMTTLSIFLTLLSCACYAGIAWAHLRSDRQTLRRGVLVPASIQPHDAIAIDARMLSRVSEAIVMTPEPVTLALFGSGLTLAGVVLLGVSRRTKLSVSARDAHWAVDTNCVELARGARGIQDRGPHFPAAGRLATTFMSSGSK